MELEPAVTVGLLALLFAATHIGLATRRVRGALVARLGEGGFFALFSGVAAALWAAMVAYYAAHRFAGALGLGLGASAAAHWVLMGVVVAGVMLMAAGLLVYPSLPTALFDQPIRAPRGIERVTRHPFFAGVALLGGAHVLLATHLVGTVLAAGLTALAVAGARHQDAKILARRGSAYADYVAATSAVPFAAMIAGRQHLVWRELPYAALAAGLVAALGLRAVHAGIFAHGGLWVIGALVGGGALASWQSWRRARRHGRRTVLAQA